MKVLVTGSASHLARALLPRLLADARIEHIVGVDVRNGWLRHRRYRHVRLDVRSPKLARAMAGADAVIHLAFVVMRRDLGARRFDRAEMRDINVRGSQHVFTQAAAQGVKTLVHCSSAAVYAQNLGSRAAITESNPRGALPGFAYVEDKIAVEDWLDGLEAQHPPTRIVRLRPHAILGPHAQPFLRRIARMPFYPRLPDPQPLTQCVHEEDVAQAIHAALFGEARGAFNLATTDAMSWRDIKRLCHRHAMAVPLSVLRAAFALGWRLFGLGTDPAWVEGLRHDLVLHTGRARRVLGWKPRYDSVQACFETLEERT
jgi:nucleoside-diphosphate-sugar epimerase